MVSTDEVQASTPSHQADSLRRLSDRFVQIGAHSRTLRLTRCTRSGAFDLVRLGQLRPQVLDTVTQVLGHSDEAIVDLCDAAKTDPAMLQTEHWLETLAKRSHETWVTTGLRDLAVGWPFIDGRSLDGTWIRAPVLLYPCWFERASNGRRSWRLRLTGSPELNPALAPTLLRLTGAQLSLQEFLAEDEDKIMAVDGPTRQALIAALRASGLELQGPDAFDLQPLADRTVEEAQALKAGVFTLGDHLILGRFPPSGSSLLQDYEQMLSPDFAGDLGLVGTLLGGSQPDSVVSGHPAVALDDDEPGPERWLGHFGALPLASDASQDAVLRWFSRDAGRGLAVQGPPGTGKSQLIANLVALALREGQRVLVVCEKRAALDVVQQRLASVGLGEPLCLVHDVVADRARLCRELAASLTQALAWSPESAPLDATEAALERIKTRVTLSQQAYDALVSPSAGQPDLCTLAWRDILEPARPVPRLGPEADEVSESALSAYLPRLGSLAVDCLPLAAPHPLSCRTDFSAWSPEDAHQGRERLDHFTQEMEQIAAVGAQIPYVQSAQLGEVWRQCEPFFSLLEQQDNEAQHRFVAFWVWTDGHAMSGQWHEVLSALLKARDTLQDVPREWIVEKRAQLELWRQSLRRLTELGHLWWRWCLPTFWRLRTLPKKLALRCASFVGRWSVGTGQHPPPSELERLLGHAQGWQELNHRLPLDNPFLRFAFDGRLSDVHAAVEELTRHTDLVRAVHRLRRALAPYGGPFVSSLELGGHRDLLHEPFIAAALRERTAWQRMERLQDALRDWQESWDSGLCAELRCAFESAAQGRFDLCARRLGRLREAWQDVPQAIKIDRLLKEEPAWARSFLKRWRPARPGAPDADARTAMRKRWLARRRSERSVRGFENALVHEGALEALRGDAAQVRAGAAATTIASYRAQLAQRLQSDSADGRRLLHEARKMRRRLTLRQLVERHWRDSLRYARPVWLCSPDSVSSMFPLQADLFDLVIFDEASQCPVEAALPVIYRAKRVLVTGDEQQMPPSKFFAVQHGCEEEEEDEIGLSSDSILALASVAYPHLMLTSHYRSRHESLITFSSRAMYGGRLVTTPTAEPERGALGGVRFRLVPGVWSDGVNPVEAEATVNLIEHLLLETSAESPPSVGVVTMNSAQMELVELLLQRATAHRPKLAHALRRDGQRPTHERLFVRNLENVQGDQRDVIILSTAYGPSADDGKIRARFGPIALAGGERRVNVAITRARWATWVLTSIDPDQLDVSRSRHPGPRLLHAYLQYAQAVDSGDAARVEAALKRAEAAVSADGQSSSPWRPTPSALDGVLKEVVDWLALQLQAAGFEVSRDVGLGPQRLNLVVSSSTAHGQVALDMSSFLTEPDPLTRDLYAPARWRQEGWKVVRVTPTQCAEGLDELLTKLRLQLSQPASSKESS